MFRKLAFLLVAAGIGCQTAPDKTTPGELANPGETAFLVNGHPISKEMMEVAMGRLPPATRKQLEESGDLKQVQQEMALSELLYRKALERGLQNERKTQVAIALAERGALAAALVDQVVAERATEDAIKKYYDEHAVQYAQPQAKLRIIVAKDEASAQDLVKQARGGADFAELARNNSIDPRSKASGGDLGWMSKKDLPPDLSEKVFSAAKGDVVGPISANGAFLVFKVEDARDKTPLSEVHDDIEAKVQQDVVTKYIDEVRSEIRIEQPGGASAPAEAAPAAEAKPAADAQPAAEAKPAAGTQPAGASH